jgi:erythromycin esterase-like protein
MTRGDIDYSLVSELEKAAFPLTGAMTDYDDIIHAARGKKFVMIGEATHGTQEFYAMRAAITQRLIQELEFDAVAVEADWPEACNVNRYVSLMEDGTAQQALEGFERFPAWMWRNTEVLHFIAWLQGWNARFSRPRAKNSPPVGFYGLDLYSMNASMHAVINYLDKVDPVAATRARNSYSSIDHFMDNLSKSALMDSCEQDIVLRLAELQRKAHEYINNDGLTASDENFFAIQNAKVVRNAEQYYRAMLTGRRGAWNIRDKHMFETLQSLSDHFGKRKGREAKVVVWAHNSHVGNAAATEQGQQRNEVNLGQLVCEAYGADVLLIGFSTSHGAVTAASGWDEPVECVNINPPFPGSYEEIFHHVNCKNFLLDLRVNNNATDLLMQPRLQRAIGGVYRPMTERQSHYFQTCLPEQFDFMIHIDSTTAVQPLETIPQWHRGNMDETYPFGV